ncbi:MAG: hypothetical protein H6861_04190 [Rhodospirillales bacterium]|nr:hypothetical protein [Rhodospirillales bacterium]
MSAIAAAQPVDQVAGAPSEAQAMAGLLGKTVEASIELGNIMDINPAEAQDDTLRVALAGLAAPLVAGQYAQHGRVPESADLKKISGALQAVLTFSDNFTPTPETVARLKSLEAEGQIVDPYQTQIQYMQAFIPVIEAISAFPFGQAEAKLIMDVSTRLVKRAVELRETLLPGIDDEAIQKRTELGLLHALAALYSSCHKAETEKVLKMDEAARAAGLSMEPVWKAFEIRSAMLEALAARIAPASAGTTGGGRKVPVAAPVQQAPEPVQTPPPAQPQAPAEPPPVQQQAPVEPPAQSPVASQSPMSMFAKPKEGGETAPPAAAPPPQPPAEQPPLQPPPAQPQTQSPPVDSQGGQNAGGGPMSFFKKKDEG